ncbi:hypothetical protein NP233_g8103 [Leucocoprinus birnbaumii]|uniref:Uncharacterized protein n=1 Tax=Leucocoprinus birnbaumii TaxID=56174 RepID=A0AAD5VRF8_9AGAR|nr:hypothetical protein NP233_g8103 [Leucocoprinus birnbaumii]
MLNELDSRLEVYTKGSSTKGAVFHCFVIGTETDKFSEFCVDGCSGDLRCETELAAQVVCLSPITSSELDCTHQINSSRPAKLQNQEFMTLKRTMRKPTTTIHPHPHHFLSPPPCPSYSSHPHPTPASYSYLAQVSSTPTSSNSLSSSHYPHPRSSSSSSHHQHDDDRAMKDRKTIHPYYQYLRNRSIQSSLEMMMIVHHSMH